MNITTLSYNGQNIEIPEARLNVSWKLSKQEEIKKLIQNYQVKNQEKVIARYNIEKDRGTIIEKTKGEKTQKTQIASLAILQLKTNNGKLVLDF